MLELKQIKKDYPAGDGVVHALKGIDLQFRRNEFVSILGPSGCGKTTLLNIIGGLDKYTSGDLIINGRSTKDFKDRDWDTYRNHSIGFVFQSYNLIPHQTVLQNVELALTLTGVTRAERKERAKKALQQVGLGNQLQKRPSQMSGGQMQRVAIARALVNNPDIILADEPTGALDSETSIQVMDILKEISKDKLIIMVTHNPELAEQYSTRIIRVLDGEIKADTAPLSEKDLQMERAAEKANASEKQKMPSMSLFTSFSLSLKNLIAKKGRTTLTAFAGSIGIIGIALITAVSQGLTSYIDLIQESTLSSYPLTIESSNADVSSLMTTFMGMATNEGTDHEKDAVYEQSIMYNMVDALNNMETSENDLRAFKEFIETEYENEESTLHNAISGIKYTYDLDLLVYTKNADGTIIKSDTMAMLTDIMMSSMNMDVSSMMNASSSMPGMDSSSMMSSMGMMGGSSLTLWEEMLPGENGSLVSDMVKEQYDVIYGSWPTEYNEVVLVVNENNELDDMTLYALGLKSEEEIKAVVEAVADKTELEPTENVWSYEEICDREYRVILNSDCYTYDEATGTYTDLSATDAGIKYLYNDKAIPLKVSGIIRKSENAESGMIGGSIAYTSELTKYVINHSKEAETVKAQKETPTIDIFTGLPFEENTGNLSDAEKETFFRSYIAGLSDTEKAAAYVKIMSIPTEEFVAQTVEAQMASVDRATIEAMLGPAIAAEVGMSEEELAEYIGGMSDEDLFEIFESILVEQVKAEYASQVQTQLSAMPEAQLAAALTMEAESYTTEQCAAYYDEVLEFSESAYEDNLITLGCIDLEEPSSINFYASTFENKDVIEDAIADYNETVDEIKQITYTDYIGLMMSSITSIINAISYILIAFVGISLIVSSIMIAVITLISVQERTKEIGILRAMGASKHEVSVLFNAETVLIGFASGMIGVGLTVLACIPINAVIHSLTGIETLNAYLPFKTAVVYVLLSVVLNTLSGFIPSKSAARKDPVVALRSE
uniref:ABC transporter ATP-binding protein/permease n=1 Tax=Agathobacter sp. TaxID=2021311 RepID=UPI004056DBB1